MEDAQLLMNGHVRMAIDNLSLAGNLVFDVDETSLVPGQNYEIFFGSRLIAGWSFRSLLKKKERV